jgi:hypothetical protein
MKPDRAHYSPEFQPVIARALEQFMLESLDRRGETSPLVGAEQARR